MTWTLPDATTAACAAIGEAMERGAGDPVPIAAAVMEALHLAHEAGKRAVLVHQVQQTADLDELLRTSAWVLGNDVPKDER